MRGEGGGYPPNPHPMLPHSRVVGPSLSCSCPQVALPPPGPAPQLSGVSSPDCLSWQEGGRAPSPHPRHHRANVSGPAFLHCPPRTHPNPARPRSGLLCCPGEVQGLVSPVLPPVRDEASSPEPWPVRGRGTAEQLLDIYMVPCGCCNQGQTHVM